MNAKNLKDNDFRNYIDYPAGKKSLAYKQPKYKHCCGMLAADGSDASATPAKIPVANVTTIAYVKTGLALLGAFVAIKFIISKIKK
jgi:hypothetical protein